MSRITITVSAIVVLVIDAHFADARFIGVIDFERARVALKRASVVASWVDRAFSQA